MHGRRRRAEAKELLTNLELCERRDSPSSRVYRHAWRRCTIARCTRHINDEPRYSPLLLHWKRVPLKCGTRCGSELNAHATGLRTVIEHRLVHGLKRGRTRFVEKYPGLAASSAEPSSLSTRGTARVLTSVVQLSIVVHAGTGKIFQCLSNPTTLTSMSLSRGEGFRTYESETPPPVPESCSALNPVTLVCGFAS